MEEFEIGRDCARELAWRGGPYRAKQKVLAEAAGSSDFKLFMKSPLQLEQKERRC